MTIDSLPYYVYVCEWDNGWLYVGHSDHPKSRRASHAKNTAYRGKIVSTRIEHVCITKQEAEIKEKALIKKLSSQGYKLHNKLHNVTRKPRSKSNNERGDNMATKTAKVSKGTLAAQRAWETRRENERARKASAAAFKAWETRRANGN